MMGKRVAALLLALLLAAAMIACSEKESGTPTPDENNNTEQQNDAFCVKTQGVTVELGADASSVLKKLGEANSSQEVFDCGAGNSRMYYRYASFDLYTMKADGKETIDQIELLDDLTQTEKGISIGAAESAVREAYGEPSSESEGMLTYAKGDQRLIIELRDGKVSAIGLLRVTK